MKTSRIALIFILIFALGNIVNAQSWLDRLGKRVEEKAKQKVEQKIDKKVDKEIDKAFDKSEEKINQSKNKTKTNNDNKPVEIPESIYKIQNPVQGSSGWDDDEPFYLFKKGLKIQYTNYNGKGKVEGYQNQEVIEFTKKGKAMKVVMKGVSTDKNGKIDGGGTVLLEYKNGNFHIDLLSFIPPENAGKLEVDAKAKGYDMVIPSNLTPGQALPDAYATFKMKVADKDVAFDVPPITYRIFNRKAVGAESVETPMGKFVCFKIVHSVEVDLPLLGKKVVHGATWIGKGIGAIKSETYAKNGKLESRILLTNLQ